MTKAKPAFYVDDFGRIWRGPTNPHDNLHYATFEGFTRTEVPEEIWVLQRTDPDPAWSLMPIDRAKRAIKLYRAA